MADRTIDILLKLKPDDASVTASERAILKQYQALKKVEAQANATREQMEKLTQVGAKMAMAGGAILAPFALAMNKYTEAAKAAQDAGKPLTNTQQRLLSLTEQWERSQERIGKVTAEVVLPALESAMSMMEKIVGFAEQNPGVVQAALSIGTTLVVLGGIVTTTAQLVATVASIQGLAAGAGAAGLAAGAGGALASGGVAVGALAIGALIGKGIGDAVNAEIAKGDGFPAQVANSFVEGASSILLSGIKGLQGAGILGKDFRIQQGGGGQQLAQTENDLAAAREKSLEAAQKILVQQHAITNAELDYAEKRAQTVEDGLAKISAIEAQNVAERAKILSRLAEENRKAEYQYNQERYKITRDGNLEIEQLERDSQKRLAQLKADFENQAQNATRSRDALGLVKAQRDYQESVAEEKANTAEEIAQRRADIALRLQDLQTSYEYERQQRQYAAQVALNEQQNRYNAELQIARENQAQILTELDAFYKAQIQVLKNNTFTNGTGTQGRAEGGYVENGLYRMGERGREFVLNNETTKAAEAMIGRRLTQSAALGLVTNNLQVGNGVTIRQVKQIVKSSMNDMLSGLASAL